MDSRLRMEPGECFAPHSSLLCGMHTQTTTGQSIKDRSLRYDHDGVVNGIPPFLVPTLLRGNA